MIRITARLAEAATVACVLLAGCRSVTDPGAVAVAARPQASHTTVTSSVTPDPDIEALLAPFRSELEAEMSVVIGTATGPITEAEPEGALGNLVADAMLSQARRLSRDPVHMALTNDGGLRVPLREGPITVGDVYEVMPFENMLTIVELSGRQVERLAEQIALARGEPVSGWGFELSTDPVAAHNVRVQGEPVYPDTSYRIVVPDYLANGGGYWDVLWNAADREDLSMLLRDAIIAHVRELGTVDPVVSGRITRAGADASSAELAR